MNQNYEEHYLLECDVKYHGRSLQIFREERAASTSIVEDIIK
jgi:hypothetical protein